jgi:biofilm PGA synthesis N-glycosyltransferase PgaC
MENIIYCIGVAILIYFAVLWLGYLFFLLGSLLAVLRKFRESEWNTVAEKMNQESLLPLTIIMPAYNEEKRIQNAVSAIFNSDYKNIHLIIVNDGSVDKTLQLLIDQYSLEKIPPTFKQQIKAGAVNAYYRSTTIPNFFVVDKEHSPFNCGADSINAGLNVCQTPLFLTVDADTLLEPSALTYMLFTYLTNPHCIAIGGDIYIPDTTKIKLGKVQETNIPPNFVLGVQVCEYLRSFLYGREGWTILGGSLCHPGAFSMLETQAVRDAGGYDASNFSYDAEMILKLHQMMRKNKYPYSVVYSASAIAWSEEPSTLKQLWRQRSNWQRGLLRSLSQNKQMVLNPKFGITGLLAFPFYILFEIFGPVVEAIAYITLILALFFLPLSIPTLLWLIFLAWGFMLFITMSCVVLSLITYNKYPNKMDILRLFGLTLIDMLFYRQYRAFCALFSSVHYYVNRLRSKPQ